MFNNRGLINIVILCLSLGAIAAVVAAMGICYFRANEQKWEKRLLWEMDYEDLLAGCRDLQSSVSSGKVMPGTHFVRRHHDDPQVMQFPKILIDADPIFVEIDNEACVRLGMGLPHYGVIAYPDDKHKQYSFRGSVELIPGLWYYHEDYEESRLLKERIDSIIYKGKMLQKQRDKQMSNHLKNQEN